MSIESPLPLICFAGAAVFAWEAVRGIRKGATRLPMRMIEIEEFQRGHTMFWGVIIANVLASCGLLTFAGLALTKGW